MISSLSSMCSVCAAAERGVNVNAVQRLPHPTRDVLVVRALDGDRTFAGFGKASIPLGLKLGLGLG